MSATPGQAAPRGRPRPGRQLLAGRSPRAQQVGGHVGVDRCGSPAYGLQSIGLTGVPTPQMSGRRGTVLRQTLATPDSKAASGWQALQEGQQLVAGWYLPGAELGRPRPVKDLLLQLEVCVQVDLRRLDRPMAEPQREQALPRRRPAADPSPSCAPARAGSRLAFREGQDRSPPRRASPTGSARRARSKRPPRALGNTADPAPSVARAVAVITARVSLLSGVQRLAPFADDAGHARRRPTARPAAKAREPDSRSPV